MKPWMPFALPAAIAAIITAAFLLAGPAGGLVAASVVALVVVGAALGVHPREHEWVARAARRMLIPVAFAVIGAVVVLVTDDTGRIIGWGIVAAAGILAISFVFLEVGYSEDRARARQDSRRQRPT